MVDEVVVSNPEARAYELADALVAGRTSRAYDLLSDLASGSRPTEPIVIHGSLVRHYRGIAAAQALGAEATPDAVGEVTGLRGYPAQKAVEHARTLPPGAGERAVVRLAALELELRVSSLAGVGRSRGDGERLVLELAARELLELSRAGG
jgi:DNA polymerase III delta subunit